MPSNQEKNIPFKRKVPWWIGVSPEIMAALTHASLRRYYTEAEVMLATQRKARELFSREFGIDSITYGSYPPAYLGAAALGAHLILSDEHAPMIRGKIIHRPEDLEELSMPKPAEDPWMKRYVDIYYFMRHAIEPDQEVYLGHGQEGPITTAVLLRGSDFFSDLVEHPSLAHKLLHIATDLYIDYAQYARSICSQPVGSWELCDDHAGNLSPQMWPEYVLPYWRRIYEALGGARRLHSELLRLGHLRFIAELGINHVDFGEDQLITLSQAITNLKVPFSWHILSVADMIQGSPAEIKKKYRQCVHQGAPIMAAEIYPGTSEENIRAFVAMAREFE